MAPCTRELRGEKFRRGGKTGTTLETRDDQRDYLIYLIYIILSYLEMITAQPEFSPLYFQNGRARDSFACVVHLPTPRRTEDANYDGTTRYAQTDRSTTYTHALPIHAPPTLYSVRSTA